MLFKTACSIIEDRERPFVVNVAVQVQPGRFILYEFKFRARFEACSVMMEYLRIAHARPEFLLEFHRHQVAEYEADGMQLRFDPKGSQAGKIDGL